LPSTPSTKCAQVPRISAATPTADASQACSLSYPLHPPRKPEQQRTQHLPDLRTPTLFVHGTRDPFGTIAELEQSLKMIPAETELMVVEGAGHDLGFKGKAKREELPQEILQEFTRTFSKP
jgi:predicted alpha/beta-hydrolase family hydrolase